MSFMRMPAAVVVAMLCPFSVGIAAATEAPKGEAAPKLKKGWVGLPFDPPVAKQIKPIVSKKTSKSKRRKRRKKK